MFQYVFSGVVLSIGPPFRQSMRHNCMLDFNFILPAHGSLVPFVITIVTTTLVCLYLLLDPATWIYNLMQFTPMHAGFKSFILVLVLGGFACAWLGEQKGFPRLAAYIGLIRTRLSPGWRKSRKDYKLTLENLQK